MLWLIWLFLFYHTMSSKLSSLTKHDTKERFLKTIPSLLASPSLPVWMCAPLVINHCFRKLALHVGCLLAVTALHTQALSSNVLQIASPCPFNTMANAMKAMKETKQAQGAGRPKRTVCVPAFRGARRLVMRVPAKSMKATE